MTHLLLRLISEAGCLYEHKLCAKLDKPLGFQELEDVISLGYIQRVERDLKDIQGLILTQSGKDELARLNAIPPTPIEPTPTQLRFQELRAKLGDNTITVDEVKE